MGDLFSSDLRFVYGWPALLLGRTLVIADVHLGIEKELWAEGIRVSNLSDWAIGAFKELLDLTNPRKVIINGDLRHNIPLFTRREAEKVREFVELAETYGKVVIVKGNHDGDIEKIVDNVVSPGLRAGRFYITHGHIKVPHRPVIIGHLHPAYPLNLHFKKELVKVWLVGEEVVVLPAFSPYIVGNDITRPENWIGPIARGVSSFGVFTLHGFYLDNVLNRRGVI